MPQRLFSLLDRPTYGAQHTIMNKLSRLKSSNHFYLCKYDLVCDDSVVEHVNDMSCDMRFPTF